MLFNSIYFSHISGNTPFALIFLFSSLDAKEGRDNFHVTLLHTGVSRMFLESRRLVCLRNVRFYGLR